MDDRKIIASNEMAGHKSSPARRNPSSSDDPLPIEKVASAPLVSMLREDETCYRMLHSLMSDGNDQSGRRHFNSQTDQITVEARARSLERTSPDISVTRPDSPNSGSFKNVKIGVSKEVVGSSSQQASAMYFLSHGQLDVPNSSDYAHAQHHSEHQIVTFPQTEVRHNAFFFVVSRGGTVMEQPGNRRMRRIINMYAEQYVQTRRLDRGTLKRQVYDLCRGQFEFVIQKLVFMRYYTKDLQNTGKRQLSHGRIQSILDVNGGIEAITSCEDTDFIRVGENCALDVVGHLLRDAANEFRRSQGIKTAK